MCTFLTRTEIKLPKIQMLTHKEILGHSLLWAVFQEATGNLKYIAGLQVCSILHSASWRRTSQEHKYLIYIYENPQAALLMTATKDSFVDSLETELKYSIFSSFLHNLKEILLNSKNL